MSFQSGRVIWLQTGCLQLVLPQPQVAPIRLGKAGKQSQNTSKCLWCIQSSHVLSVLRRCSIQHRDVNTLTPSLRTFANDSHAVHQWPRGGSDRVQATRLPHVWNPLNPCAIKTITPSSKVLSQRRKMVNRCHRTLLDRSSFVSPQWKIHTWAIFLSS